jgi:hypothetical protein
LGCRVAAVPFACIVAFSYGVGLHRVWGFFSLLPCRPSHCRRIHRLCTCAHPLGEGRFDCGRLYALSILPVALCARGRVLPFWWVALSALWHYQ